MSKLLLIALVILTVFSFSIKISEEELVLPVFNIQKINHINSIQKSWTAGYNTRWNNLNMDAVKRQCGAFLDGEKLPQKSFTEEELQDIPATFDARTQWGKECPSVSEIRDQGDCGSCWAFGASEAMTDRICVASMGKQQYHLSAQDILSCCWWCGMGCNGGQPSSAWAYWNATGVVTGGNYKSNQGCLPYSIANCDHHVNGTYGPCAAAEVSTPSCTSTCVDGESWSSSKQFGASSYSVSSNVAEIQAEIYTNGPVEGAFTVYDDFPSYKSGVYVQTSQNELGGHAIKILGWGTEGGVDYWLVANSWNIEWGMGGFFKIQRGVDMCGIESGIVAGLPSL